MNSFRHLRSLALVVSAVACCVPVQAQDFKAGFVNTDRIFREANSAKAAQAKLEQEFSRREKDIIELGNSIKAMSEKYERDAPTLSESQRVSRQKQLVEQDRDLQRKRREFQEDLNAQERRVAASARAGQPGREASGRSGEVRRNLPGSGLHQSEARHHGQGDQGAERRHRQIRSSPSDLVWHSV